MTNRIAMLVVCVAIAMSVGCERSTPPESDDPEAGDGGSVSAEPPDGALDVGALSDDALADRIARLRDLIVPPVGTALSSVSLVYGQPRVVESLPKGGKGSSADYPMHVYDLLPPQGNAEFRALLLVTCRNDAVARSGINHHCVLKGRRAGPRTASEQRALRVERQRVLLDLQAIQEKYGARLEGAAWGR